MSAEANLLYEKKSFMLTLTGRITVHFLDGQTLEGEITGQDEFNLLVMADNTPFLIPRSQIRYIKGTPGQRITTETTPKFATVSSPLPILPEPEAAAATQPLPESPPIPVEPGPARILTPEPAPMAQPGEIVEPVDESGGTLILPPLPEQAASEASQTIIEPPPFAGREMDTGVTFILKPEAEPVPPAAVTGGVPFSESAPAASLTVPQPDIDEDVTFVLKTPIEEEISTHLVCTAGPHAGEVFKLKDGLNTLGRTSDNGVPLFKDKEISRRHAIIAYEASKFVITDQNSLNGTFVNDQPIREPYPLEDGDLILIGVSILKFQERV